jgi:hypothetical protein
MICGGSRGWPFAMPSWEATNPGGMSGVSRRDAKGRRPGAQRSEAAAPLDNAGRPVPTVVVIPSAYGDPMDLSSKEVRITQRMRDALIADLVREDPTDDYWFGVKFSARDVTFHLSRQLRLHAAPEAAGIHETLEMIATVVSDLLQRWSLPEDLGQCQAIAHEATKHLGAIELVGTLLAGPPRWQSARLGECKVERLEKHLQPLLEQLLANELKSLFERWVKWDIRNLRAQRETAIAKARTEETARVSAERIQKVPFTRPNGKDREDRYRPQYQPPGRT